MFTVILVLLEISNFLLQLKLKKRFLNNNWGISRLFHLFFLKKLDLDTLIQKDGLTGKHNRRHSYISIIM